VSERVQSVDRVFGLLDTSPTAARPEPSGWPIGRVADADDSPADQVSGQQAYAGRRRSAMPSVHG
jgi:hypothetical protein